MHNSPVIDTKSELKHVMFVFSFYYIIFVSETVRRKQISYAAPNISVAVQSTGIILFSRQIYFFIYYRP